MSKHSHSVHFGGGQSSLSSPGGKWVGVNKACHPEKAEKSIERSEIRFLPCSGSQKTAPSPAFQAPSPSRGEGKAAFTLAEVLITLGIIGIVAAMTMPALIQKHRRMEASSKLKKFYSMMSQAVIRSELDNGKVDYWDKDPLKFNEQGEVIRNTESVNIFFHKYLAPYIKYTSATKLEDGSGYLRVTLTDSSLMYLYNGACTDVIFDINGDRQPNEIGYDIFKFLICPKEENVSHNKQSFSTYIRPNTAQIKTREGFLNDCKTLPGSCSYLLQYDNWEFKDDYPYKL